MLHGFLGAFADTFPAFDAESVIYDRKTFGILGDCAYWTCLDQRTDVVVRAEVFVDNYHGSCFFVANLG